MYNFIKAESKKCTNCYKCIRHCSVKAIKVSEKKAIILDTECIFCGECFVVCPHDAMKITDDVDRARELISSGANVYASIDPSFYATYNGAGIKTLEAALKKLGFANVEESAVGATLVKKEYERKVKDVLEKKADRNVIISSNCTTINLLIQKYYPEAIEYLAGVVSPLVAHAKDIKRRDKDAKVVFFGPCLSRKAEAIKYSDYVDCVLSFDDLTRWFEEEGIDLEAMKVPEEKNVKSRTRLFPILGGIIDSMDQEETEDFQYLAIDGIEKAKACLEDIISGRVSNCFIEMNACVGSCIAGPLRNDKEKSIISSNIAIKKYAGSEDFEIEDLGRENLQSVYNFLGTDRRIPGAKMLAEILKKMGKTLPEHEYNCGACGYETCKEKAYAVYQGKADTTMCLPYLIEKADLFSENIIKNMPNGVIVLDETASVVQINERMKKILGIKNVNDIVGYSVVRILEPSPFIRVLKTGESIKNDVIYVPECKKYLEQTIIYDKSFRVCIGFFRDITEIEKSHEKREKLKTQTIETTDKIVEKQMRIVQEIASLLGETTAETKVALTQLKEALNEE